MTVSELEIKNLDLLLPEEKNALYAIYSAWIKAREEKRWKAADELRNLYKEWDSSLPSDGTWHPHFESELHRKARAFLRMRTYGVDIYPWNLKKT